MKKLFNRPYIIDSAFIPQLKQAVIFGLFVVVFLAGFQPFKLNTYPGNLLILSLGYGAVCTIVMLFLNFLIPQIFTKFFVEENWSVANHILWTTVNVAVIGLGNAIYSSQMQIIEFTLVNILIFELFTLSLAFFPIALGIVWNENRLSKKYQRSSEGMNKKLENKNSKKENVSKLNLINIPSENANESFTIEPNNLLFVKAAENYAEVFFIEQNLVKKKVVRTSLKSIENANLGFLFCFRCHKSYIANLNKVYKISGNAQGLKLHFKAVADVVPVSRQLNATVKNKLETLA